MRIAVIFTGGTIGSCVREGKIIGVDYAQKYKLLEMYKQKKEAVNAGFYTLEPYRILSENLGAEHLNQLIFSVQSVLDGRAFDGEKMDGIIITHGTDTLQYTAAVLGYIFGGVSVPVLLVSSDYVLEDERANGLINFHAAMRFIEKGLGTGVFVSYANPGCEAVIHRGTRLEPPVALSADVYSVKGSFYGKFKENRFIKNPAYRTASGNIVSWSVLEGQLGIKNEAGDKRYLKEDTGDILCIRPYVGMKYPEILRGTKVVLHESFHSGTICVGEGLKRFAKEAEKQNIPIYLTGLDETAAKYETVGEYRRLGIIPLRESSVISQYCKLWLALSRGVPVREVMAASVGEDFIRNTQLLSEA